MAPPMPPPSARLAALPKIADAFCASGGNTAGLGGLPVGGVVVPVLLPRPVAVLWPGSPVPVAWADPADLHPLIEAVDHLLLRLGGCLLLRL